MNTLTVAELREKLQEYVDILDNYDDNMEIETVTNTYYINSQYFMQFGRIGFVDLGNLEDNIKTQDYDEDDEDNEDE